MAPPDPEPPNPEPIDDDPEKAVPEVDADPDIRAGQTRAEAEAEEAAAKLGDFA